MNSPFAEGQGSTIKIPHPMVWLVSVVFVTYFPSLFNGISGIDDFILIYRLKGYNSVWKSVITAFVPGAYGPWKSYYRPVFYDSIIINYKLFGTWVAGYHITDIALHAIAVCCFYRLLNTLKIDYVHSFILALIFAVHPVLSQAVSWIPGRNDVLLAIFVFSYMHYSIRYSEYEKVGDLTFSIILLLLAFFTKETGTMAPLGMATLSVFVIKDYRNRKTNSIQWILWFFCYVILFMVRSSSSATRLPLMPVAMVKNLFHRLPVVCQYLGKIFFPFNLSVFPNQNDTSIYPGICALIFIIAIIILGKHKNYRTITGGVLFFLVFIFPVLLFSQDLISRQTYEHRLYIPIAGLLIMMPQTAIFQNRLTKKQLFSCIAGVIVVLAAININHQTAFRNGQTFWQNAYKTSPSSTQARLAFASSTTDTFEARNIVKKAISENPNERYLNFIAGMLLQKQDSFFASEPYLLKEQSLSHYYECNFYLARVALAKNDIMAAADFMKAYIGHNPYYTPEEKASLLTNAHWQDTQVLRHFIDSLQQPKIADFNEN